MTKRKEQYCGGNTVKRMELKNGGNIRPYYKSSRYKLFDDFL